MGGNFDKSIGKVRPGIYINNEATANNKVSIAGRGIVLLPIAADWGPEKTFLTLLLSAPNALFSKIGYNIYDKETSGTTLAIREAMKLASTLILYRITAGAKASLAVAPLTVEAKYSGKRGNDITYSSTANAGGGFDVRLYVGTTLVFEQIGAATIGDLKPCDWVEWKGEANGVLTAKAGTKLAGGTTTAATNQEITGFLDASETVKWNTMSFPFSDEALKTALKAKIKYFREGIGKNVGAVAPNFEANCIGIIGVDNGVVLSDGTVLSAAEACAWVAAADAAANYVTSNTFKVYEGAVDVNGIKNNEEAVQAINSGLFFFSVNEKAEVVVEYDINTLTDFEVPNSKSMRKNRVRRVLDTYNDTQAAFFPPNKFDNDPNGWDLMESTGKQILTLFLNDGAITNVDLDNDFLVDRAASSGDEAYITTGIQPVDSAEKIYITNRIRG